MKLDFLLLRMKPGVAQDSSHLFFALVHYLASVQ